MPGNAVRGRIDDFLALSNKTPTNKSFSTTLIFLDRHTSSNELAIAAGKRPRKAERLDRVIS